MAGTATTTAADVIKASAEDPVSFAVHSLASNTVNIWVSQKDPSCALDYEELIPGATMFFEDFIGVLYIRSASGTATFTVPFSQFRSETASIVSRS